MNTVSDRTPSGRRWCEECHGMRDVTDVFVEDTGDSRVTVEVFRVTMLSCDHSLSEHVRSYPSPLQQAGPAPAMTAPDPFFGE